MGTRGKSLEAMALAPGIRTETAGAGLPTFPDYTREIVRFLRRKPQKTDLPFVNQDRTLLEVARALSTEYPYVVLIGESGIGKSMILDYAINVITGKVPLALAAKQVPQAAPLFKKIIARARISEHSSYLFVPNFKDPMNVTALSYTDRDAAENDCQLADSFCSEVAKYLGQFPQDDRKNIRITMTPPQFGKYIKARIHDFYTELYHTIQKAVYEKPNSPANRTAAMRDLISLISISLPEDVQKGAPTASWQFLTRNDDKRHYLALADDAGFNNQRTNVTREDVTRGLENSVLPCFVHDVYARLTRDISTVDVDGMTQEKVQGLLTDRFKTYTAEVSRDITERFRSGQLRSQQDLVAYLKTKPMPSYPPRNISPKTVNRILKHIKSVCDQYHDDTKRPELRSWFRSVHEYFSNEPRVLREALSEMLDDMDERDEMRDRSTKRDGKEKDKEEFPDIEFRLRHGNYEHSIDQILCTNFIPDQGSTARGVTWKKIGQVDPQTLFATFTDDDDQEMPPHMRIAALGNFFKGSILVFQDCFGDFVDVIASDENKSLGMRELFLEYLQTGVLSLVNNGVTYHIRAPRMILGCDNHDPFNTLRGQVFTRDEAGLRARIRTVQTPDCVKNAPETRQGALRVLYDTIARNNAGTKGGALSITPEAANMLLKSTLHSEGLASVEYRKFTKQVEDACAYAVSTGHRIITPDLLKQKVKDSIPATFFKGVDYERDDVNGYFRTPQRNVGHVHGLVVYDEDGTVKPGFIVRLRSHYLPVHDPNKREEQHFRFVDEQHGLEDESSTKGFELATHYVRLLMAKAGVNRTPPGDWSLNVHIGEQWSPSGGPSASMAMALSMVSELAGEPVYRNRFMTGTIDPKEGLAGAIGGAYYKALIPMRLREIARELGQDEQMYFLFPACCLKDLTQNSIFDPFDFDKKITCLPIHDFAQAYHIFTCGPTVTDKDWTFAKERGEEKLLLAQQKIKDRFAIDK